MSQSTKRQKRPVLLLEILIGLSLLSLLVLFLFRSMATHAAVTVRLEKIREEALQRQHLQMRLSDLFLTLAKERPPSFYTQAFPDAKEESIVLVFDNGVDPDPRFSGTILGRIFVDSKGNLSLAMWPLEKGDALLPWRKEILYSSVQKADFTFFGRSQQETFVWDTHWSKERPSPPYMIRLKLEKNQETTSFAWIL
ncbi:MAG: hypothetical protein KGI80_00605 [Verrucomicrobiota bacterium]|nr:hypothetical protein [Verrucomicrobiota bacterium]